LIKVARSDKANTKRIESKRERRSERGREKKRER
jgi:hypothetical protein